MMTFKVFAGTVYCGLLNVDVGQSIEYPLHKFIDWHGDDAETYYCCHPRIANYKHLNLQRTTNNNHLHWH